MLSSRTCSPNSHNCRERRSSFPGVGAGVPRFNSLNFFLKARTRVAYSATRWANLRSFSARLMSASYERVIRFSR